jgi:hypothetical protein
MAAGFDYSRCSAIVFNWFDIEASSLFLSGVDFSAASILIVSVGNSVHPSANGADIHSLETTLSN